MTHIACGNISPNMTMPNDEIISATYPLVKSSNRIDIAALTITFPINNEHKSRFPDLRTGNIIFAYLRSFSEPENNSNILTSNNRYLNC